MFSSPGACCSVLGVVNVTKVAQQSRLAKPLETLSGGNEIVDSGKPRSFFVSLIMPNDLDADDC